MRTCHVRSVQALVDTACRWSMSPGRCAQATTDVAQPIMPFNRSCLPDAHMPQLMRASLGLYRLPDWRWRLSPDR
ncbi:hypothetical protein H5410_014753 [Solanum commersonii]|uniref:Uncharacterized protein n=1 Tax=Solanum commersonii TaxID=4109 RepID=A0A9J5ZRV2_SOLCO|nr:hypothetical protein H5410_014753 [Solanum commersonii]